MSKVFLGVGHGGSDPGAIGNGLYEKNLNLSIATHCKNELERNGVSVRMSRYTDEDDRLAEEIRECNAYDPDLCVDVHNNAGGGDGFEVYYSHTGGKSLEMAKNIEREVLAIGQNSRGCKLKLNDYGNDWFGFIRQTNAPAALVECAFVDTKDVEIIDTEEERKVMGIAIAKGILKTLGVSSKPTGQTSIMGSAVATAEQLTAYVKKKNADAPNLAQIFIDEGKAEGVRGDIAFAQSCLETGNFTFGGDVKPNQNNYAGIGATGGGVPGNSFDTPQFGVRAQIQHLKAYASTDTLKCDCVDPRFKYVTRGSATYVEWLGIPDNPNGKGWAAGENYGAKILAILTAIIGTSGDNTPTEPQAPIRKSVEEIASEVLAGKWGNGQDRKEKLTAAGYDYSAVQKAVNAKLGNAAVTPQKTVTEIAKEVIRGEWGNGQDRKNRLVKAGYNYGEVQNAVNRLV